MTTTETVFIVLLVSLLAAVAIAAVASRRHRVRRAELRRRFGPEYDRALQEYGSAPRAERALEARTRRVNAFHFRDLNEPDRVRFATTWSRVQEHFIDDPSRAVREANELIKEVMIARGYPPNDFEQRVADLSVDHADVVQHYRAAHALADSNLEGRANTEELRQAVVHYRALFSELLRDPESTAGQTLREQHA
jgi:hypothetical protein